MTKNIVILCDGTGNKIGGDERTNIVDMLQGLENSENQFVFYDMGVGTQSGARFPLASKISMTLKKATGFGVRENIREAYRLLMDHYEEGDQVFLMGFSRGAYTARLIAGLVMKVGLLRPGNSQLVDAATNLYFDKAPETEVEAFKRVATRDCPIHFVGVFDTVASMAIPYKFDFFSDKLLHPKIHHGIHAVAIDERRGKFPANLWDLTREKSDGRIEQVWFAGVHSDVGGWYKDRGLSAIALLWMLKHARNAGMLLKQSFIEEVEALADPKGSQHTSYTLRWKFLPPFFPKHREIPEKARVHDSVRVRRAASDVDYDPPNLPRDSSLHYVSDPQ